MIEDKIRDDNRNKIFIELNQVMKRLIFSMHLLLPIFQFVDNVETNLNTKKQFLENFQKLIDCKKEYVKVFVDFVMVNKYLEYYDEMKSKYPYLITYNIINFYKIYLLYKFSSKYDEILYLDFDINFNTKLNF